MQKPKVIVIIGPTASGKTALSIELAKRIGGEIVSADSMQIYKHMNIGTAKPTLEEMSGIIHHMIDIANPDESFNVAKYKKMAEEKIDGIVKKGKLPIIVGGTGLYINFLINGIEFSEIENDFDYRNELQKRIENEGIECLYNELAKIDPESAKKIDKENVRRVIRALEIYKITGKTKSLLDKESINDLKYDYVIFGLDINREVLYERINMRVDNMINNGLIEEVQKLVNNYKISNTAIQGLGYKEVIEYLNNNIEYNDMIEKLKMETRRYAKRQITWFKRDKRIKWVSPEHALDEILKCI